MQTYYIKPNLSGKMKGRSLMCNSLVSSGYHMYSYSLNTGKIDPCGSTNYGMLNNASLVLTPGRNTVNKITERNFGPYRIYISSINHNVLRISKGTLGFPIL